MFELIREHQMNIMLALSSVCGMMVFLLLFTRFLTAKRKWILIGMEAAATLLLTFDRMAYIYSGNVSREGYVMVRVSNFMVFFLTSAVVLIFNLYLTDLISEGATTYHVSKRLTAVNVGATVGMLMVILSQVSGLYYSFDENNHYQRGPGFLLCYVVPIVCPLIQFTVVYQYRKKFSRLIYTSLLLYIFVPIIVGVIQIFTYGISIVNMAIVLVSVSLYIFTYLDINDTVEKAHVVEIDNLKKKQAGMRHLFEELAEIFAEAVDMRDDHAKGRSRKAAEFARKIAKEAGKSEEICDDVYYASLLHDVGKVILPDTMVGKLYDLTPEEEQKIREVPKISSDLLVGLKEAPQYAKIAAASHENYDGTGYPRGIKKERIPEMARIVALADAYAEMTTENAYHKALPYITVREEVVKQSGFKFDPKFTTALIRVIDKIGDEIKYNVDNVEKELICQKYRENISLGIPIGQNKVKITFRSRPNAWGEGVFSSPSLVLFDSFDGRVHDDKRSITAFRYNEFGELWFDGKYISTEARNMEVKAIDIDPEKAVDTGEVDDIYQNYEIIASRYEDHSKITLIGDGHQTEVILALSDRSRSVYIGLTGENVKIRDIFVEEFGVKTTEDDIARIAPEIDYIDRIESDVPNVQIDRWRSAATDGVEIYDGLKISFFTTSLPTSNLVWHCPYILIFYSDNGKQDGDKYKEYALIKINGECSGDEGEADNRFIMKKKPEFPGWEAWKELHREGMECKIEFLRRGDKIITKTENLGISLENTTTIRDGNKLIYVAITGDQVALTDIRIR